MTTRIFKHVFNVWLQVVTTVLMLTPINARLVTRLWDTTTMLRPTSAAQFVETGFMSQLRKVVTMVIWSTTMAVRIVVLSSLFLIV